MPLYDTIGSNYATVRRPDPRIASAIRAALGDAASVVNIGAGTGAYEPTDRSAIAVEPSEVMIRQRPASAAPCIQGSAEALPLETRSIDAAMCILTLHHWSRPEVGLREVARVARKRAVFLTWVPDARPFWLTEDYFPEILANDREIFPSADALTEMLERCIGPVQMTPVPVPRDCTDGILSSYWRRPEAYLDPAVRSGMSAFARIDAEAGLTKLRDDLASGRWTARNGDLMNVDSVDWGYRIAVCEVRNVS